MTAFIVDDSPVMRRVLERALRQAGVAITKLLEASNGAEALTLMRAADAVECGASLMLVDINMPNMDGLELVEQMRAENLWPEVPIIMVTTDATVAQVKRALAADVAGYLRKPFTTDQIKASVLRKLIV